MEQKTHAELWAAHEKQDWSTLWTQAASVVQLTVSRMKRTGEAAGVDFDELVAEGNLAAGSAVREWSPLESTFSTWISFCVRRRLLTFVGQQRNRDRSRSEVNVELVPDTTDVLENVQKLELRNLLQGLPGIERLMVTWYYGLEGEKKNVKQIADALGIHRASVHRSIELALERLRAA